MFLDMGWSHTSSDYCCALTLMLLEHAVRAVASSVAMKRDLSRIAGAKPFRVLDQPENDPNRDKSIDPERNSLKFVVSMQYQ